VTNEQGNGKGGVLRGDWWATERLLEQSDQDDKPSADEAEVGKVRTRDEYDEFNRKLNELRFGKYAYFLNWGYVPNEQPSSAVITPAVGDFDVNSRRLVLEVIADCPVDGKDILDVSCGRGSVPMVLKDYFRPRSYLGVDISSEAIAFCREHHRQEAFTFREGDAEDLPVESEAFDVVVNIEASHNYPHIRDFFSGCFKALRPEGWFLYTDLLAPRAHERNSQLLREIGFAMTRNVDISSNVLLSCDETAVRRMKAYRDPETRSFMASFLGVPGSKSYRALERGSLSYRLYTLRKPSGSERVR
jgi:ubiquinone/menaquinone biosynthesis C-methylase UbiE